MSNKTDYELLTDLRYIVTNVCGNDEEPYPGSPFHVGDILTLKQPTEKEIIIADGEPFTKVGVNVYSRSFLQMFPKLFRKLHWFEKREGGVLPEYVRFPNIKDTVVMVNADDYNSGHVFIAKLNDYWYLSYSVPATREEYLKYKKRK